MALLGAALSLLPLLLVFVPALPPLIGRVGGRRLVRAARILAEPYEQLGNLPLKLRDPRVALPKLSFLLLASAAPYN